MDISAGDGFHEDGEAGAAEYRGARRLLPGRQPRVLRQGLRQVSDQ